MAKYDAEFKFQVVQAYIDGKGGYRTIAKRFGIPNKSLVEQWVRQYKKFGYKGIERRKKKKKYSMNFKMD
ncbi:MAG: transposase, partial [Streptococcaceae bacterium]|nr:transposase [Streptococcaceae bacterium]